jgi:hypothetical protein
MRKRAVCFGINNYPGTDADLSGCVNDVKDWSRVLQTHKFDVRTVLDSECTLRTMKEEIGFLVSGAVDDDVVVIQYSGHGSFVPDLDGDEPDGVDECLVPYDFHNGMLLDDDLNSLFKVKESGVHLLFISDSCHSGTVSRFLPNLGQPQMVERKIRFLSPSHFLSPEALAGIGLVRRNFRQTLQTKLLQTRAPALLMSGCQDTEYSLDCYFGGRPNGAFTFHALQELRKLKVGKDTYADWFKAIRTVLPTSSYPQTPNMVGTVEQSNWKIFA